MPAPAYTVGPQGVALAANTPQRIVAYNPSRVGLFISNGTTLAAVLLSVGPVDPSSTAYSWRLNAGDQLMLPLYGSIQEIRALCGTAIALGGGLTFTEFTV